MSFSIPCCKPNCLLERNNVKADVIQEATVSRTAAKEISLNAAVAGVLLTFKVEQKKAPEAFLCENGVFIVFLAGDRQTNNVQTLNR